MKKELIVNVAGFELCREDDFYYITPQNDSYSNLSGTKEEVVTELKRWQDEVDKDNEYMRIVEDELIEALEKCI